MAEAAGFGPANRVFPLRVRLGWRSINPLQ